MAAQHAGGTAVIMLRSEPSNTLASALLAYLHGRVARFMIPRTLVQRESEQCHRAQHDAAWRTRAADERTLPASGTVRSQSRIIEVVDKGAGRGAVVYQETVLGDAADGSVVARCWSNVFARADGGFGGISHVSRTPHAIPDRAPDMVCDIPTFANAAMLYRLNGDLNPLHSDPATAARAGFKRPILQGLCTYGVCAHAVIRAACCYDPARLRRFDVWFSSSVYPGETVSVEIWQDGTDVSFRAHVRSRGVEVIDNGYAVVASS